MKFNLINLSASNLRDIYGYLTLENKLALLLLNKESYKTFHPLLWEDLDPRLGTSTNKIIKQFKKNGKYIKYLRIRDGKVIKYNKVTFPNVNEVYIDLKTYVKDHARYKNLSITHLRYGNIGSHTTNLEYMKNLGMDIKSLFSSLTYIYFEKINQNFIDEMLNFMPSRINELQIRKQESESPFLLDLLEKFTDLQVIKIYFDIGEDHGLFEIFAIDSLIKLYLVGTYGESSIHISSSLYPNLRELRLDYYNNLMFSGTSYLTSLELQFVNLEGVEINQTMFPSLKNILVYRCDGLSCRFLYSLFQSTSITDIELFNKGINNSLLVKEIYPEEKRNLFNLKVHGFSIDNHFLNFAFTQCKYLRYFNLTDCEIIPPLYKFSFIEIPEISNLEFIYIIQCDGDINDLLMFLLDKCDNLLYFHVTHIPELSHNYMHKLITSLTYESL